MMKTLIASLTLAAFAAPALAQQPATPAKPPAPTEDKFTKHDTDKNGSLSITEVKVVDASVTAEDFAKYDSDKDKELSQDEFQKWADAKTAPPASSPGQ
jgi:hypothetical protein